MPYIGSLASCVTTMRPRPVGANVRDLLSQYFCGSLGVGGLLFQRDVLSRRHKVLSRERAVGIRKDSLQHDHAIVPGDLGDNSALQFRCRDGHDQLLFGRLRDRNKQQDRHETENREHERRIGVFGSEGTEKSKSFRSLRRVELPCTHARSPRTGVDSPPPVPESAPRHRGLPRTIDPGRGEGRGGASREYFEQSRLRQPAFVLSRRESGVFHLRPVQRAD